MPALEPFNISESAKRLLSPYPDADSLKDIYTRTTNSERLGIIRLWLTEGIPYAFKEYPLLYEELRDFIAKGMNIGAKEVTLVGSARTGYSLAKDHWGKPFGPRSDFDFVMISDKYFGKVVEDYQKWTAELRQRKVLPRSPDEMSIWLENIKYLDHKIPYGFIQVRLIPYSTSYPNVKRCLDTVWLANKKLEQSTMAPKISGVSARVYASWKSCLRQLQINFGTALGLQDFGKAL